MQKALKINFKPDLVKDLVKNILVKTPGIDATKKIIIELDIENNLIDIKLSVKSDLTNAENVAKKAKESVYYHIKKEFDLEQLFVEMEII